MGNIRHSRVSVLLPFDWVRAAQWQVTTKQELGFTIYYVSP